MGVTLQFMSLFTRSLSILSFLPLLSPPSLLPSLSPFVPPELTNSGQRRDALRLTCLLLPQANRDTLQELLQFLSRVAMHSDGIILLDGTEVGVACGCGLFSCAQLVHVHLAPASD